MKDFNFDQLRSDIVAAAKEAFSEIAAQRPSDDLCAFALYSDSGAMTVCPAMCTTGFLATKAQEKPGEYLFYKYSPSEWPLEGVGAGVAIGKICKSLRDHLEIIEGDYEAFQSFQRRLMETCVQAQEQLRKTFFATRSNDFLLLVTISDDDEPAAELQARMDRLNSPHISAEFAGWVRTWGSY